MSQPANAQELNLLEVLTQILRRKSLIAKGTLIALLIGVIVAIFSPREYIATTSLMPPQQAPSSAAMLMNQAAALSGPFSASSALSSAFKNPSAIYVGLLSSRSVADALITRFNLLKIYHAKSMTAARNRLGSSTKVEIDKNGLLLISVKDHDRIQAAALADGYTTELRNLAGRMAAQEANERKVFFETQLKEARDRLIDAEVAFQSVQKSKGIIQPEAQTRSMVEGIARLRSDIIEQRASLQTLQSYTTDQSPQVQLRKKQLADLEAQAAAFASKGSSVNAAGINLGDMPDIGMQYLNAEHELQMRQAVFDMLLKQYNAAQLDESKSPLIVEVVEPAVVPETTSGPRRALIVLGVALSGFIFSVLFALASWAVELATTDESSAAQMRAFREAGAIRWRFPFVSAANK
jgi:capsule polysaccharide export protein KpsE/RkpR